MRHFSVALLLPFVFCAMAYAQEQNDVRTERLGFLHDRNMEYRALLGHTQENPFTTGEIVIPQAPGGTHMAIRYRAVNPLPVIVGFVDAKPENWVTAVLPPSQEQEVVIDLTQSPAWTRSSRDLLLRVFTRGNDTPEIVEARIIDESTVYSRITTYFRQPFWPEVFTITSTNYLFGYRTGDLPIAPIAAALLLIAALLWSTFTKRYWQHAVMGALCIGLLAYQTRVLADIVPATVSDIQEWTTIGTLNELEDLYAIAENAAKETPDHIVLCGDMVTPAKYLFHPISVEGVEQGWNQASHGILADPWDEEGGTIACGGKERRGTVIGIYPGGSAFVRFEELPTRALP